MLKNIIKIATICFVVAVGLVAIAATSVTNVHAKWVSGNLVYQDNSGNTIFTITPTGIVRTTQEHAINTGAKIGATSTVGWALGGGAINKGLLATLAQSATADTLVIPIPGLKVGDTITSFTIHGQLDSGGNAVTVDADLRAMTPVATGSTDASIGAITQISKTADYLINDSKTGLTATVTSGLGYYILVTATTGATCDIEITSISVTVTTS